MSSKLDPNSLNMSGYSIGEIHLGQKASVTKTIEAADVYTYAGIIGDINPVHVNAEYAKTTRFRKKNSSRYAYSIIFLNNRRYAYSRCRCNLLRTDT